MDPATLARVIAFARLGFGAGLLLQPERLTGMWVGEDAARAGTKVAVRGLGARDLALGAGAALSSGVDQRRWVAAAIAADAADLVATVTGPRGIPLRGRLLIAAVAGPAIALGAIAFRGLQQG